MPFKDRVGLMIGVPLSGKPLVPEFTWAFASLHPPMNFNVRNVNIKGYPVAEARNWIAAQAVEQQCEFLFFIDEDVTPPAHTLRQFIFQMRHHPEAAVVAGVYCHKLPPAEPMIFRGNGAGGCWDWKAGEFFEVSGSGMGCTMIRTEIFEKMSQPWFKTVDNAALLFDGIPRAEQWTEDLYFYEKLRNELPQWKAFCDASVIAEHWNPQTGKATLLPPNCNPLRRAGVPPGKLRILDIGCGSEPWVTDLGEVIGVDIDESVNPDYRCDARCLPFDHKSFDMIYSSHVLEHIRHADMLPTLDEWCRVLKDDGEMRLILPNVKWAAEQIVTGHYDEKVINVLWGGQENAHDYHCNGFTPQLLEELLKARGFKRMDFELIGYNLCVRAFRKPPVPTDIKLDQNEVTV